MSEMTRFQHDKTSRRTFLQRMTAGAAGVTMGSLYPPPKAMAQLSKTGKSRVSFMASTDHREAAYEALKPLQQEVGEAIGNKQVVIKVNAGLASPQYFNCSSHADQIRGILEFLKPIHDRTIIITEGTAGAMCDAFIGFKNYNYMPLEEEYNVKLMDSNLLPYTQKFIYAAKHRPQPINIINIFFDPDVYLISAARMKTHNAVVATCSLKNVTMGSPMCHFNREDIPKNVRNEKSMMHGGVGNSGGRELSYNLFLVALMGVQPDLALIDAVESIEGNGPWDGEVVKHGVAVASTDFVAADRLCIELMGIDPKYMKYLEWCGNAGMGAFDLSNIQVIGPDYKKYVRKYALNKNFDRQVEWIEKGEG